MKASVNRGFAQLIAIGAISYCASDSPAQQKALLAESEEAYPSCLTCSADGKSIAFGTFDGKVHLWNWNDKQSTVLFEHPKAIPMSAQFSPSGQIVAIGALDNSIRLIDVRKKAEVLLLTGHDQTVWSIVFRPDGKSLVSASGDGTVRSWDCDTGKQQYAISIESTGTSVALSSDGKLAACGRGDGKVLLLDAKSGAVSKEFAGHSGKVIQVRFVRDDKTLVSGGSEGSYREWDLESGKEQRVLETKSKSRSVAFSSDGKVVTVDSEGTIRLWDFASGKEKGTLVESKAAFVLFGSDRGTFFTGARTIKVWNAAALYGE